MSATESLRQEHIPREVLWGYPADPETGDVPAGYIETCNKDGEPMPCRVLRALGDVVDVELQEKIGRAIAAKAAAIEMRWRETQEREIRFQPHVLDAERTGDLALENLNRAVREHVMKQAYDIERERLQTVPEQSEWHIHIHGVKVDCPRGCDSDHICPGCGEWLHHGKGVCGGCDDEVKAGLR